MKRLTAEEVAGKIESLVPNELLSLADLVRDNLVPQWQDEPDGDGWYWVEGRFVSFVRYEISLLMNVGTATSPDWFNNTTGLRHHGRVCPIGARPQ